MPVREWTDGIKNRLWLLDAACGKDWGPPADFFHSKNRAKTQTAMAFCNSSCPVRMECLEDAMRHEGENGHRSGVFGGHTARGRRDLAAKQRRAAAAEADGGAT